MKATDTFRKRPFLHNCAQAVACKYAHLLGGDADAVLERFSKCGTGRAPGGLCGALHAAVMAMPQEERKIVELFKERTGGHLTCADIKARSGTSCPDCVQAADDILEKLTGEGE